MRKVDIEFERISYCCNNNCRQGRDCPGRNYRDARFAPGWWVFPSVIVGGAFWILVVLSFL